MSFFKVWWPYTSLFAFIFLLYNRYIHTYIHSKSFIEAHLHVFTAVGSVVEPSLGAEPRFELVPALQQASELPIEPRCTLELSHAAP
jgi:hypothetical protein